MALPGLTQAAARIGGKTSCQRQSIKKEKRFQYVYSPGGAGVAARSSASISRVFPLVIMINLQYRVILSVDNLSGTVMRV